MCWVHCVLGDLWVGSKMRIVVGGSVKLANEVVATDGCGDGDDDCVGGCWGVVVGAVAAGDDDAVQLTES